MPTLAELRAVAQAGKHSDPRWYRIHRRLSFHVTRVALALGVEADQASVMMMAVTLSAALLLASASASVNVAGFALGYAGFLLDKVDGELARLSGHPTMRGILLDRLHHRLVEPALLLGIAWHEYRWTGSLWMLVAGFAAMVFGNAIDEHQHLGPVVLHKHVRQGGALPDPAAMRPEGPGVRALARVHHALRPLKAARTVALSLPLAAVAYVLERVLYRPVPGWWIGVGAGALGVFLLVQCVYYAVDGLEREAAAVAGVFRRSVAVATLARPARPERVRPAAERSAEVEERWAT